MGQLSLTVLCEDACQRRVIHRFTSKIKRIKHPPNYDQAPIGTVSAYTYVLKKYPIQLNALRKRHVKSILVVMIDGDNNGVEKRLRQLNDSCRRQNIPPRTDNEPVAIFVPTRTIETWLTYLDDTPVPVNEKENYKRKGQTWDYKTLVETLRNMGGDCSAWSDNVPSSLVSACREYRKRCRAFLV